MKPINENEFEIREPQVAGKTVGLLSALKYFSAAICTLFQTSNDATRVSARLRRDAGIDEREIEKKQLARAPLIR